ncbi:MAG: BREX system P-loop protein BrxC [Acidobacteriota bacterium]|nr:BREX system P-loop protein BrxC [Acidobacteriota bacterium]
MKIHELLDRDPRGARLANNGQARLGGDDDRARAVLREELSTFVCDGRFGDALQRILDRYLGNVGSARQDAAWVSGFFGSGKSHLLKMAAHLWENTAFADGGTARGLVGTSLPADVHASLRELDTQAKRSGRPPVAAAGTLLGGNDWVRRTVLEILLRACGWPDQYAQAQFCFWLRDEGALDGVRAAVEAKERDWQRELNNLYVSPVLGQAVTDAVPGFASDVKTALQPLRAQFPPTREDITTEQFVDAARRALSDGDDLPHTVLVLDEVQQYIGADEDKSSAITELAEAIQTRFDSRLMLIGAGQSALSADTPHLAKLRDRFVIRVELTDADVEAVTRRVLLSKKPSAVPEIKKLFEAHAGEVARHLRNTRIGARPEDAGHRVEDYPLLPTRRRFWEACFRAVDAGGAHSQLRSQLRILHDSLNALAARDLGAAIPASDLFDALAPDLVSTGVLLGELDTRIRRLDDETERGRLRRDLCGLAFLIGRLPRDAAADIGVRATASTLADLLVTDITADAAAFRRDVEVELESLAEGGELLKVGDEYRLQTTEGAEWDRAYREQVAAMGQDEVEIARVRNQLFGGGVDAAGTSLRLIHGDSKIRRVVKLHAGEEAPAPDAEAVSVWWRDGWSVRRSAVENEARRAGIESPVLFAFLPRRNADELRDRILAVEAAQRVLDLKGSPASPEGQDAKAGMESRRDDAARQRAELVLDVLRAATVYQGGGTEAYGEDLRQRIERGAEASLARLFPEFDKGDHRAWEVALRRARDGSATPLQIVGWDKETSGHPVAREVLARTATGARGTELHRTLRAAPFGWPQDAVDAVLVALHRSGHLRAVRNGVDVTVGALDQAGIKAAEFRPEKVVLTVNERIALRGLFQELDVRAPSGEEAQFARPFLDRLLALAESAGGAAPLPPVPSTAFIDDLSRLGGAEQLAAINEQRESLGESIAVWRVLSERRRRREPAWRLATGLRRHTRGLPEREALEQELEAIERQRSLLEETDRLAPLAGRLAGVLRNDLAARRRELAAAVAGAAEELAADATWRRLAPSEQAEILRQYRLTPPAETPIATVEELLVSLEDRPLSAWQAEVDAVRERASRALAEAVTLLGGGSEDEQAPISVAIRPVTLADEAAVRAWLREQEERLLEAVRKGPVVLR